MKVIRFRCPKCSTMVKPSNMPVHRDSCGNAMFEGIFIEAPEEINEKIKKIR